MLIPLHSLISTENQEKVFDTPPPGIRKIILSTNIAETGVTIEDVTVVIDTGMVKEIRYVNSFQCVQNFMDAAQLISTLETD
jgi:ATP-dependent RNA helicase DHX29